MRFLPVIAFSGVSYWMLGEHIIVMLTLMLHACMIRTKKESPQLCYLPGDTTADILCSLCNSLLHQCWNKCICISQYLCSYDIRQPNGNRPLMLHVVIIDSFISRYLADFLSILVPLHHG